MITKDSNGAALSAAFIAALTEDNRQYEAVLLDNGVALDCAISRMAIVKGSCGSEDGFTVGSVVGSTLTAEVKGLTTAVKGKELEARVGVEVGGAYTYVTLGHFTITEAPQTAYATTLTGYGKIITKTGDAFNVPATPTLANIAASVAASMTALAGKTVTVSFASGIDTSKTITASLANITVYNALEVLASVCGGFATDTYDGNVMIYRFGDTPTLARDTATMRALPVVEEDDFSVAGVLCIVSEASEDEEGTVIPAVQFPQNPTGNENLILQNPYATEALYNANLATLAGYTYRPATIGLTYGDPRLEGVDVVQTTDVNGNVYIVPCHALTHTFDGGFTTQITAANATPQENETASAGGSLTEQLSSISANVISARASAESAKASADAAAEILDDMQDAATAAGTTLTQIYADAETAKTNAAAAVQDASDAKTAAESATASANSALTQLGTVEDVIGTLDWIAEHAVYHPTFDQEAESGKLYFEVTATAVTSPTASGLPSYYELNAGKYYPTADTTVNPTKTYYTLEATPVSVPAGGDPSALGYYQIDRIDEAVSNYIATHLALTDSGLYILMDESGYKLRLTNDGAYIEDPSGATVATYSTEAVIGNLNGYNYLRLSRTGLTLTTDGGQSAAFEVVLYDDTTTSASASFGHQFETYNGAYIAGLDPRIADGAITLTLTMYNSMDGQTYTETKTFTAGTVSQQTAFVYNDPQKGEQKFLVQYDGKYFIALVCQYNYASYTLTVNGTATYYIQSNRSTYYTLGRRASGMATGQYSVAEGYNVTASGNNSHAQNTYTIAGYNSQTAIGKYNDNRSDTAFEIGNGSAGARSNALIVDWGGNVMAQGMAGMIQMFAGATEPEGWLFCDGTTYNVSDYPELAAVLGSTYGGDGLNTFAVPDMRGRFPLGVGTGTATDATTHTLNQNDGTETVKLTAAQSGMRAHVHATGSHYHATPSHTHSAGNLSVGPSGHKIKTNSYALGSGGTSRNIVTSSGSLSSGTVTDGHSISGSTAANAASTLHTYATTYSTLTDGTLSGTAYTNGVKDISGAAATDAHNNMPPYIGINFIIATGKTA